MKTENSQEQSVSQEEQSEVVVQQSKAGKEENKKKKDETQKKKQVKHSTFSTVWKWPLLVLVIALSLSFSFGVLSEYALSGAGIAVSIVVIVVFIIIAIITDMIGVAVTVAEFGPFRAMASKKVRGAKEAIKLVKNAEKVASVSADILGDICSILSGSAGATVAMIFIGQNEGSFVSILIASAVSAVVAGLTIFGKALGKNYAMKNAEKIVLVLGKIASLFHSQKENKKKDKEEKKGDSFSEQEQKETKKKTSKKGSK